MSITPQQLRGARGASMDIMSGQIKAARAYASLTRKQLAEISGISPETICNLEFKRTGRPRRKTICAIEEALSRHGVLFTESGLSFKIPTICSIPTICNPRETGSVNQ